MAGGDLASGLGRGACGSRRDGDPGRGPASGVPRLPNGAIHVSPAGPDAADQPPPVGRGLSGGCMGGDWVGWAAGWLGVGVVAAQIAGQHTCQHGGAQ